MAIQTGFRGVKVLADVTEGKLDPGGAHVLVEVTNKGASEVEFFPNDFAHQGHTANDGIPIAPGATRTVPMTVYNFRASGEVTVVAYRM